MQFFNNVDEITQKYKLTFPMQKQYGNDIVNIFNGNILSVKNIDGYLLNIIGLYYKYVKKDYDKMKQYYLQAIELQNSSAMNNLGYYYKHIKKDYDKMKKYYLQAIELKHSGAMNNFGYYYKTIEKDYDKMKQYYLQAIELNDGDAMNNLGCYYHTIEKDYDKMTKYYLQSIELNNSNAMKNLSLYFKSNIEQLYYVLISIENKNDLINNKITELLNLPKINTFNNKINYSIENNIIRDCSICMENNKLNICFTCMHFVCVDCYLKLDKCSYCKCIK